MVDDMNAPGGDILEELSEQAVDFLDSELSMELSEALPQEILPVEEIPPAVESQEEKLDRAASSILALAAEKGIHGNVNFIERELALIGDIESFRALLIDSNGLSVAGSLPQDMDRDALAAYSSAVCQMAQEVLDEHGVSKAGLIHIEGESGRVKVFQAGGHYLMAHQEGKADADDDFEASPGDAPVKKGMEELPRGEWAFGSLIASRDGKLLKAALTQGLDGPTLAHMSARLLAQCWRYAGRLPVGRVLRIYVRNEEVIFCLVPLENRAVLTVLADPSIPWDTWQGSLHHAAQALAGAFA
jgi:predicted regulator of Ras-like GTPase activity (Roadblock/LC7/MglB family)